MNARATMSSKGQIVVPKAVRDAHGWESGTEFEFVESGEGVFIQPVEKPDPRFPPISWEEFEKRRIRIDRPFPSDREIEESILAEAARRFDATRR
jgi:AbrB family looped-hinge helix DNA binding protein